MEIIFQHLKIRIYKEKFEQLFNDHQFESHSPLKSPKMKFDDLKIMVKLILFKEEILPVFEKFSGEKNLKIEDSDQPKMSLEQLGTFFQEIQK